MLSYTDSHCHLDFPAFGSDLEALIEACNRVGVRRFIVPAIDWHSLQSASALADRFPGRVFPAVGLHPCFMESAGPVDEKRLLRAAEGAEWIAVGETGLDGRFPETAKLQAEWFDLHLSIAAQLSLPVIVHAVRAHQKILAHIKRYSGVRLVVHAFSGSYEQAKAYIDRGAFLGVGGVIARPTAHKTRDALARVPLEHLLLETDSPDMAPRWSNCSSRDGAARKGYRNTPLSIPSIARRLADIRKVSLEALAVHCEQNAGLAFPGLKPGA